MYIFEWKKLILEEIKGMYDVIVYHTTGRNRPKNMPIDDFINLIIKNGLKSGNRNHYGKGIYTNYEIPKNIKNLSEVYGNIILKLKIDNVKKFVIFDTLIAKKVHGVNYKLIDQLKVLNQLKYLKNESDYDELKDLSEQLENEYDDYLVKRFTFKFLNKIDIDGIIFNSPDDRENKVLLIFNPNLINFIGFSVNYGKTWEDLDKKSDPTNIKYNPSNKARFILHKFHKKYPNIKIHKYDISHEHIISAKVSDKYEIRTREQYYTFIDENGDLLNNKKYLNAFNFENGFAVVTENGNFFNYLKLDGTHLLPERTFITCYDFDINGYGQVRDTEYNTYYVDKEGGLYTFDEIYNIRNK